MEDWRAVVGWEGRYEVSDKGRVRSVERTAHFSDGRVRVFPSVMRATHVDTFGYEKLTLKRPGCQERVPVHHLVAAAWIGPRPPGWQVCHADGNCTNNGVGNLRYDTAAGNRADSIRHGTSARPSMRKFSDEDIAGVRALQGKATLAEVAEIFGISKTHVCNIQRGNRRAA